ncbi:adenylyltransferase/cytidyltransferase family protein [Deinococcus malanensis]|uniref:adenylyltransferase/cytidyltransferase family protein n=1 Tax=Deinococcus malanensis TaxID=1706855 RepID=UPI00363631C7
MYIGRFEPPHQAHLLVMLEALQSVQKLIVVIGSARAARNTKNPFTAEERQDLIWAMLLEAGVPKSRVLFVHVRDYFYNESLWLSEVQAGVQAHTRGSTDVALIGHLKDESSYYLRSFPAWEFIPTHVVSALSATDVRRAYFEDRLEDVLGMVPPAVHAFLVRFHQTPNTPNCVSNTTTSEITGPPGRTLPSRRYSSPQTRS